MRIDHLAVWATDLERLRAFYETYFDARSGAKYANAATHFESYFLSFDGGGRLEVMWRPDLTRAAPDSNTPSLGYAHLAVAVGSEQNVNALTDRLRADGFRVLSGPRRTGDGYYESVVLDPEGNPVEITV